MDKKRLLLRRIHHYKIKLNLQYGFYNHFRYWTLISDHNSQKHCRIICICSKINDDIEWNHGSVNPQTYILQKYNTYRTLLFTSSLFNHSEIHPQQNIGLLRIHRWRLLKSLVAKQISLCLHCKVPIYIFFFEKTSCHAHFNFNTCISPVLSKSHHEHWKFGTKSKWTHLYGVNFICL